MVTLAPALRPKAAKLGPSAQVCPPRTSPGTETAGWKSSTEEGSALVE